MVLKGAFEKYHFSTQYILHAKYKTGSFIWKITMSGYQSEDLSTFFYSRELFRNERYTDRKGEMERLKENKCKEIEKCMSAKVNSTLSLAFNYVYMIGEVCLD